MPTATVASASHTVVTTGWTSPSNAFASTGDNVYATAIPGRNGTVSGDFFPANIAAATICDGARIIDITATCEWKQSASVTGGVLGVQLGTASLVGTETTVANKTVEGDDTVNQIATWAIGDLRAASTNLKARVRVSQGNTSTAMTASLDFVKFDIDYIPSTCACLGC